MPLADGGDGTIDSLHFLLNGTLHPLRVLDPLGREVEANWLKLKDSESGNYFSVVELASASGIAHLKVDELDAMNAHSRGCGQILAHSIAHGIEEIYVTVGGSASTDGGMGILTELGAVFKDQRGKTLNPCGKSLSRICTVEIDKLLALSESLKIHIITDVTNPLFGERGAAYIYGPQKGASEEEVKLLDEGLKHYASILERLTGKGLASMPGAGAAGGVPFGLSTLIDCEIQKGFDWFSKITGLESHVDASDCIITAEGYLDSQTLEGKAIGELSRLAASKNKKLWVVPAKVESSINWKDHSIERVLATSKGESASLEDVTEAVARLCSLNR